MHSSEKPAPTGNRYIADHTLQRTKPPEQTGTGQSADATKKAKDAEARKGETRLYPGLHDLSGVEITPSGQVIDTHKMKASDARSNTSLDGSPERHMQEGQSDVVTVPEKSSSQTTEVQRHPRSERPSNRSDQTGPGRHPSDAIRTQTIRKQTHNAWQGVAQRPVEFTE